MGFRGLQAGVDEGCEGSDVSGVEDDDDVLHIGAVLLDVLAEVCSNLAVALEQILTRHTLLTGSATARNDVLSTCEGLLGIDGVGEVSTGEGAVAHLVIDAMHTGFVDVIQADVGGETQHQHTLHHVGADHTAGTDNHKLFVC